MALSDDVQNRIPSTRLIELTNPRDSSATSIDTTVLGYAVTDITGDFELLSCETFSDSNPVHVAICVPAVVGKLYEYDGRMSPQHNESYDVFVAKCDRLREGNIPGPETNAPYDVVWPDSDTRKKFDRRNFNDYRPLSPRQRDYDED